MSYDVEDFKRALMKALEQNADRLITPEMAERQQVMKSRNHERLVRLGLVDD